MVSDQLRRRGIGDERVLAAMAAIPREEFVGRAQRRRAYADAALPIGRGQTISQPWIVAAICQALALRGDERVLEVGTGSGYSAAVLSLLAADVVSVERIPELAADARQRLERLGIGNAEVIVGDGSAGAPERGPFAGIAVHATSPRAPEPLLDQLAADGRLVIPIASSGVDMLTVLHRVPGGYEEETIGPCRFVPLIGAEGFPEGG
jgi:protein-L-isoaspartate(D-aspartate) O-methyltransferase